VRTLLIDEGFGTLDPATLEMALSVLEALRQQGRQVGVISHVPQLVERVGAQHARYFVDYCERLAKEAARAHRRDSLERLAAERANLRLAYERLLRAGAAGYVLKRTAAADVVRAIRALAAGDHSDPNGYDIDLVQQRFALALTNAIIWAREGFR